MGGIIARIKPKLSDLSRRKLKMAALCNLSVVNAPSTVIENLIPIEFHGVEGISIPFDFRLSFAWKGTPEPYDVLAKLFLAQPITVQFRTSSGSRFVHGFVSEFWQDETEGTYSIRLESLLWFLSLQYGSRVFCGTAVKDIVTSVLKNVEEHSRGCKFEWTVTATEKQNKKELIVQRQETSLNFLKRLLEAEGYYYYFEHPALHIAPGGQPNLGATSGHKLVISNIPLSVPPHANQYPLGSPGSEGIDSLERGASVAPQHYAVCGHNPTGAFVTCSGKPTSECHVVNLAYEEYCPAIDQNENHLSDWATIRAESLRGRSMYSYGTSSILELYPTKGIHVDNGVSLRGIVPTKVTHDIHPVDLDIRPGRRADFAWNYSNEFESLHGPMVQFRPPRITPIPRVPWDIARIVGPHGEELPTDDMPVYVDKDGRVAVRWPWQREEKAEMSATVPLSHPWLGADHGLITTPRIGDLVLIGYVEGDPDYPYVIKSLGGITSIDAHFLPHQSGWISSRGTAGPGKIQLDDTPHKEEILVEALRQLCVNVHGKYLTKVDGNCTMEISKGSFILKAKELLLQTDGGHLLFNGEGCWLNGTQVHINSSSPPKLPAIPQAESQTNS